jgi:hypothetical protein
MSLVQSWLLQILLNYILILRFFNLPFFYFLLFLLVRLIRIGLHYFETSFNFYVFIHVFSVLLLLFVKLYSHLFDALCDEDASPLGPRLRLANIKHHRIILSIGFFDQAILYFLFSFFQFLLCIFLNVVEFSWVNPSLWEEIVVLWILLLESLQMHAKSTFPTQIIHTQKVIDSLSWGKTTLEFGSHATICPKYVPVIWIDVRSITELAHLV